MKSTQGYRHIGSLCGNHPAPEAHPLELDDDPPGFVDWLTREERIAADRVVSAGLRAALGSGLGSQYSRAKREDNPTSFGRIAWNGCGGVPCAERGPDVVRRPWTDSVQPARS